MALDDYDPSTALSAYFPSRDERRTARLWATEKLLHDLRAVGLVDFFEGPGSDPTALDDYAITKLWLRVSSGVTEEPGEIRAYDGSGDATQLANWPELSQGSTLINIELLSALTLPVTTGDLFMVRRSGVDYKTQLAAGTYTSSANYGGGTANSNIVLTRGSVASPESSIDAPMIVQKHSSGAHVTPGTVNATIYASIFKNSATALARATAGFFEAQDQVGGSDSFVEGVRGHGTVMDDGGSGYGVVGVAGCDTNVAWDFLIAIEGWVQNNTAVDQPTVAFFDKASFAAGFIATGEGTAKSDAGFVTNPFSTEPFRTGFLVAEDSVDDTAFASRAATVVGLDLSQGSQSYAAMIIPNNTAFRIRNGADSADSNVIALDASDTLFVGFDAVSVSFNKPIVMAANAITATGSAAQYTPFWAIGTHDGVGRGPLILLDRQSPSPAANDLVGGIQWNFNSSTGVSRAVAFIDAVAVDVTNASEDAALRFLTMAGGATAALRMTIQQGVYIGAPTGLDQGAGTLNLASNLYVNGSQVLGARDTGFTTAAGSANKNASGINVGTITASDANIRALAAWVKALHDSLATHGAIGT